MYFKLKLDKVVHVLGKHSIKNVMWGVYDL